MKVCLICSIQMHYHQVPISMDGGETVVLQEVIGIGDLNALTFERQE